MNRRHNNDINLNETMINYDVYDDTGLYSTRCCLSKTSCEGVLQEVKKPRVTKVSLLPGSISKIAVVIVAFVVRIIYLLPSVCGLSVEVADRFVGS